MKLKAHSLVQRVAAILFLVWTSPAAGAVQSDLFELSGPHRVGTRVVHARLLENPEGRVAPPSRTLILRGDKCLSQVEASGGLA